MIHGMHGSARDIEVTVVIPVLNGERYLAEVLDAVAAQQGAGTVEILVIDSGSTDASLGLVRARPGVRLHEIPNDEFGHGRTRNLGARLASGRVVAFLTQDATPAGPHWLRELILPLSIPSVVGVFGRQLPRSHAFPLQKYDIGRAFEMQGPPDRVSLRSLAGGTPDGLDRLAFYSDVNSASTRAFLTEVLPYRDIAYSEDLAFARDALTAGFSIAYAPAGAVLHSNDATIREYRRRMFDETVGQRRSGSKLPPLPLRTAVAHAGAGALRDSIRILRDRDYGPGASLRWLIVNPWYHLARWRGMSAGSRAALDDLAALDRASLEATRRESAARSTTEPDLPAGPHSTAL
ncbi:glycosyltransferase family 2 protein [Agromyces sp. NPDC058136]|uniref:glycosyltransferase family 2 protein n=1 Tax=Agromyces sp. NPDC058136 TaxID=3346354 RepID=UPI0036D9113A